MRRLIVVSAVMIVPVSGDLGQGSRLGKLSAALVVGPLAQREAAETAGLADIGPGSEPDPSARLILGGG
jgi:hypothetical protein